MTAAPGGTINLLCTNIEDSTQLLHRLADAYPAVLEDHLALYTDEPQRSTEGYVEVDLHRTAPDKCRSWWTNPALAYHTRLG